MAESDSPKDMTMTDTSTENFSGGKKVDKQQLIENGGEGVPEAGSKTYGEVAPLQLDVPHDPKKHSEGLKAIIISCIVFAVGVTVALIITIYCAPPQVAPHGAVSCDVAECSSVGADLLKEGGSAVDAAVGALFCLSVVQPESSGLGGGGFLIYRNHRAKKTETINFRETAPQNVDPQTMDNEDLTNPDTITAAFTGVPGFVKGMWEAHQAFGELSWSELIQPSIDLARNGFTVSEDMAYHLEQYIDCAQVSPVFQEAYCRNGTTLKEGTTVTLLNYSNLLEKISEEGADYMYNGDLAQEIVNTVSAAGGVMTLDDLSGYRVDRSAPKVTNYGDYAIESLDAPSGGPLVLFMMNVLDRYNMTHQDMDTPLYYHRFIEAAKFSNALAEYLGDPLMNDEVSAHADEIISRDYAMKAVAAINDNETFPEDYYFTALGLTVRKKRSVKHTTHVSVIGPDEDHVAITNSLNYNFGSKVITPSGLILNNQLLDFDSPTQTHSNPNNQMVGGARPTSHMAPTLAHSRDRPCGLRLAIGAVGGWSITSEIVFTLLDLLTFHTSLEDAIEAPRIYYDRHGDNFRYEKGLSDEVIADLESKGHNMTLIPRQEARSVVNGVMKVNETVSGHADSRRGGEANVF